MPRSFLITKLYKRGDSGVTEDVVVADDDDVQVLDAGNGQLADNEEQAVRVQSVTTEYNVATYSDTVNDKSENENSPSDLIGTS